MELSNGRWAVTRQMWGRLVAHEFQKKFENAQSVQKICPDVASSFVFRLFVWLFGWLVGW